MRSFRAGICLGAAVVATAALALLVVVSSASAAESFGIKSFFAGTCTQEGCGVESEPSAFFTQAAGRPNFGITDFKFNGEPVPVGNVRTVRVDLPAGLSVNPQALPQCKLAEFEANACKAETHVGTDVVTLYPFGLVPAPVYNLEPTEGKNTGEGLSAEFGVNILGLAHSILEGGVSWHKEIGISGREVPHGGDYHEYFIIKEISNSIPLLESRLIFEGRTGKGFLTLPSACEGPQTTELEVESYNKEFAQSSFTTHYDTGGKEVPVEATGCATVPVKSSVLVTPASSAADQAQGATIEFKVPQEEGTTETAMVNTSTVKKATVALPEGMTFNPAAAVGLGACTNEQFGKGTANAVNCPSASQIGTVKIETPNLPAGSLAGNVYVGTPESNEPGSGKEYRIFIAAESKHGVDVRLEGKVVANPTTGQLTTVVAENPPLPFSDFILKLTGPHVPLANPIVCGSASASASFIPFSTGAASGTPLIEPFVVNNCQAFGPTQSTSSSTATAGGNTNFTLNLTRPEGQPYISKLSATLPPGLVGKIPSVPLCGEPQAAQHACSAASEIGTATVQLGSGATTLGLAGTVYLTGPYEGAPYGLLIVTNAEHVGPYNYGLIVTRAKIEVNPYTAQLTVSSSLPTVVGGAPIRLRSLSVAITRSNFMINPTNCAALATSTALTSTLGSAATATSPFQATGCSSLAFKPKFSYSTNGNPTKRFGARLDVKLSETAGNANIKTVKTQLPMKMPSELSTLKLACAEKTFAANPYNCPSGSNVGGVTITTPTLPGKLTGPAYFVSHGGAAFPDLDLVVKGDGVTVILVGKTNISKKITHTTFESLPDVPVSSFELNLPTGPKSALAANGNFCNGKMYMPTTVIGQNGKSITEKIQIQVAECPVRIVGHRVRGKSATITAAVSSAGRLSTSGRDLVVVHKRINKAVGNAKIDVKLSRLGRRILATKHRITVRVRVGFKASTGAKRGSQAFMKLVFKS